MSKFNISGEVERFPGKMGWHYVRLNDELSGQFREMVKSSWPALLGAKFKIGKTTWESSIMPIKDGPMFIALPAKVRVAEKIELGQIVSIDFSLKI